MAVNQSLCSHRLTQTGPPLLGGQPVRHDPLPINEFDYITYQVQWRPLIRSCPTLFVYHGAIASDDENESG